MADSSQVLIRRLSVEYKGIFSRKPVIIGWTANENPNEALCRVSGDGTTAVEIKDITEAFKDGKEGDAFFAVFRAPFEFSWKVNAGADAQNFNWTFDVSGFATIKRPELFAAVFRGIVTDNNSYSSDMLEKHLGTIPSTVMHDKIIVDVLGVLAICDKDVDGCYVDMKYRLERSKEVGERVVSSALNAVFCQVVDSDNVVVTNVNTFRAISADREAAEKKKAEMIAKAEADRRKEEAENVARQKIAREKDNQRDEERKQKEHELKMAELEAQKKKLEGGDAASAFAAFEMISNVLEDVVASNAGNSPFTDILKDAKRAEAGLRILALVKDKKRSGGVTLAKKKPSFQARPLAFTTKKTPALHTNESLSSEITNSRRDGYLTILNVSECNDVIPMLPNEDWTAVRIASGEKVIIGDDDSDYIGEITETGTSGVDNLVAIVSDEPLLQSFPPLLRPLSAQEAEKLVSKLESLDEGAWSADVISFVVLP